MGCSPSQVYEGLDDPSMSTTRHWRVARTEQSALALFTSDGTITGTGSQSSAVELRSLLDYELARVCLMTYIQSNIPSLKSCMTGWIDIQAFKEMAHCDAKVVLAVTIKEVHIKGNPLIEDIEQDIIEKKLTASGEDKLMGLYDEVQTIFFQHMHDDMFILFKLKPEYIKMNRALRRKYNRVKCTDFEYFDVLGEGGFGMVCSVRKKSTGVLYAMKIQRKERLFAMFGDEPWRADFEKQAFASCKHPFIVELFFAFQTKTLAMLVMSLGSGNDLAKILKSDGRLTYEHVVFYSAEITSALSYLHHKGFIYRDLKPGNVLLNADGHIQLVDFGAVCDVKGNTLGVCQNPNAMKAVFAKQHGIRDNALPLSEFWGGQTPPGSPHSKTAKPSFEHGTFSDSGMNFADMEYAVRSQDKLEPTNIPSESDRPTFSPNVSERANSLIGTYGYMAPEMVLMMLKKGGWEVSGYTKAVDWWSLGVTIYKLLTGKYPFEVNFKSPDVDAMTETEMEFGLVRYGALLEKVDYSELERFPNAVGFLSRLLTVEEKRRMGYGAHGLEEISSHPFFVDIDWVALEQKLVVPPRLPIGFEPTDISTSYSCIQHVMVKHNKTDWVKGITGFPDPETEKAYIDSMQAQFEYWDYTSPAAVFGELEAVSESPSRDHR